MPRRLYFDDGPYGPRLVLRRSNTTGHRSHHEQRRHHHHLADDVIDHVRDRLPRFRRPWQSYHSDDESEVPRHRHHRYRSGEAVITWEEWRSLVERERAFRKQADQLQGELSVIKSQLEDQKVASAALARDNNDLAATIRKFQDANREFARENEALRNQLAAERGVEDGHHRELRALRREVEKLREEREGLLDRIAKLKDDLIHGCGSGIDKLLAEIGGLKKDVRDVTQERNEWRDRYQRQLETQNRLRDRIHDMQCRIDKLQEEVDRCQRRHAHIC